ncbi:MAG: four helix bundle protein [Candidatus Wallbacteria bacterium]|nr:four helix bundle protein [Candidatus Wallbacteria bacterium]
METFDHEKLRVYAAALDFVVLTEELVNTLSPGRSYLRDQLRRAAASVPLNIAEGAGEFSSSEKARFYRMARRSATECSAILEILYRLDMVSSDGFRSARSILLQVVAMLVKLAQRHAPSSSVEQNARTGGKGRGTG